MLPELKVKSKDQIGEDGIKKIAQIKLWVSNLDLQNSCPINDIFVSEASYQCIEGNCSEKTIICLCKNLPTEKMTIIHKPLVDVSMEDVLKLYCQINKNCD